MSWRDGFRISGVINKNKKDDKTAPEFKLDVNYMADYDIASVYEKLEYRISSEMNKIVLSLSNDSKELKIISNGKLTVYNLVEKSTYDIMQDDLFEYDSFSERAAINSKYIDAVDEIIIPDGSTEACLDVNCSAKSIIIPDSVEFISCGYSHSNFSAFLKNVKKIVIDESNPYYGSFNSNVIVDKRNMSLFATCQNSIIPEGVKIIDESAFFGNTDLKSIVIPNSVEVIENDAFAHCSNLENITFSSNLKRIGDNAFFGCKNLKEINLPESLKKIGRMAFCECVNLENVVIPDTVERIGNEAFDRCFNLERIILPENAEIADDLIGYGEGNTAEEAFGPTSIEPHKYKIKCNFDNGNAYIGTKSNPYYMLLYVIKENYEELKVHKDIKMVFKDLHCKIVDKNGDKFIVKKTEAEEKEELY